MIIVMIVVAAAAGTGAIPIIVGIIVTREHLLDGQTAARGQRDHATSADDPLQQVTTGVRHHLRRHHLLLIHQRCSSRGVRRDGPQAQTGYSRESAIATAAAG